MMQLPIFEDLRLNIVQAQELACYWNVAGNAIGIIDRNGFLTTFKGTWERPGARDAFQKLKQAMETNSVSWIMNKDDMLVVDFTQLRYNQEWIRSMLRNQKLGVTNSEDGLKLFQKREYQGSAWYQELAWRLKGVTVESLGFENSEVVSLYPDLGDPNITKRAILYFAP